MNETGVVFANGTELAFLAFRWSGDVAVLPAKRVLNLVSA